MHQAATLVGRLLEAVLRVDDGRRDLFDFVPLRTYTDVRPDRFPTDPR